VRFFIKLIFILTSLTILSAEEKLLLIDGTVIQGEITSESDLSIMVKTKYGEITIKKSDLLQLEYEVQLNSGEKFTGLKIADTASAIILKTNMGELTIQKSEILDIKEVDKITSGDVSKPVKIIQNRRAYSLADMLFGTGSRSLNKDAEFALGEEKLIDTFFDPTANVLEDGTLYLSGLSFAFGLSEKLQISSRWSDFFWGNFNIRPKYQLFKKGNWEKESALAVGGHFHTYWQPDKLTWQSGEAAVSTVERIWENGNEQVTTSYDTLNYGGYFPMGATVKGKKIESDCYDCDDDMLSVKKTDDLDFMFEFFTAYTFSKARKGMKGRISSTIGALVQIPIAHKDEYPYRLFGSLDLDITPQLKIIGEAFYDPFFIDLNNRQRDDDCGFGDCFFGGNYTYETDKAVAGSDDTMACDDGSGGMTGACIDAVAAIDALEVTEDDLQSIRPIHFDFGFMYAVNEHLRIGIHNQPYILAFYWKF